MPALGAGGVFAGAAVWLIGSVWRTCDIGTANGGALLAVFLVMWGVLSVLWGLSFKVFAGRRVKWAWAVAVCVSVGLVWAAVAWIGVIDSYPDPFCPGNVPPWWPDAVPV
nr:hypothetical protein [Streptomyces sp. SID13726]